MTVTEAFCARLAEEIRQRANAQRRKLDAESPSLHEAIEKFFAPAVKWYFKDLRERRVRGWATGNWPNIGAFAALYASEWWSTTLTWMQEQAFKVVPTGVVDVGVHMGRDFWPKGLYQPPNLAVSEDFAVSVKVLHRIGAKAREAAPNELLVPRPAARLLELLGYEIKNAP